MAAPGEPEADAVVTMAALVAALTFLSGFVSARLHDAYRDGADRRRQLETQILTGQGDFPEPLLVDDYEATRGSVRETLATPVLVALVVLMIAGVLLDVITGRAARLRWIDLRAPDRSGALWLLALTMLIVTVLVITDYARLRRRLEASVDASPVSVVLRAEASVARVWTA